MHAPAVSYFRVVLRHDCGSSQTGNWQRCCAALLPLDSQQELCRKSDDHSLHFTWSVRKHLRRESSVQKERANVEKWQRTRSAMQSCSWDWFWHAGGTAAGLYDVRRSHSRGKHTASGVWVCGQEERASTFVRCLVVRETPGSKFKSICTCTFQTLQHTFRPRLY